MLRKIVSPLTGKLLIYDSLVLEAAIEAIQRGHLLFGYANQEGDSWMGTPEASWGGRYLTREQLDNLPLTT